MIITKITKAKRIFILIYGAFCMHGAAIAQPLAGSYTINSAVATGGTNFQSFSDFAASLNSNGISANVTATVTAGSGPYQEQVVFSSPAGTSATSGIVLEGSGETLTAITDSSDRHALRLADCDYFRINNLHVVRDPASTHAFYGIHILGTGNHINLSNCEVDMTGTSSTLIGGYIASGSATSILVTGDFHDVTITGCVATGGGYGASVFGLLGNLASGIVINNNTFNDFHSNGVYLRETQGAVVSNNHFDKSTPNITSANAIQVAQAANINTEIFGNFIRVSQVNNGSVSLRGIYLFDGTGHRVYNNVIHEIHLTSGNFTAIEVRTGGTAPIIAFNTISIDNPLSTTGDLIGISEELSNTNSILRNNLVHITQPTTGDAACLALGAIATVTTAFDSDYNLFWIPGGNVAMKSSLVPVYYPTLANWNAASGKDGNSVSLDPMLVSPTLPQPTNPAADNLGITYGGITTDVLGVTRGVIPDIGAYEFTATGIPSYTAAPVACYPNPSENLLYVELPQQSKTAFALIADATGKTTAIHCFQRENKLIISTADLPAGLYMLKIMCDEKIYSTRFLKTNL
ncbi:MAG TPA: T9SS type A sorting domain-containing protein [Bacteroidia bacterium]|nr:T9SS type A sorting domain-containing protein [Bacteroidia bacterium]